MTRVDLVDAISPNRLGSDKSKWDPDVLSRDVAEWVVDVVFEAIVETLLKGETVDLPIGTFEVKKPTRPTLSGQSLKIEFKPGEWLNEPAGRPGRTGPPRPVPRKKKIRKFKPYPREEQLKQMLKVARKWIVVDQGMLRDEVIYTLLPDAKKWLDFNRGTSFPELPLRPAALLLETRPPNFNESAGVERLAAWADWFKSFLAHCAPLDHSLREEAVNMLIDWANATLPRPDGIGPWGPNRVKTFHQLRGWRP